MWTKQYTAGQKVNVYFGQWHTAKVAEVLNSCLRVDIDGTSFRLVVDKKLKVKPID